MGRLATRASRVSLLWFIDLIFAVLVSVSLVYYHVTVQGGSPCMGPSVHQQTCSQLLTADMSCLTIHSVFLSWILTLLKLPRLYAPWRTLFFGLVRIAPKVAGLLQLCFGSFPAVAGHLYTSRRNIIILMFLSANTAFGWNLEGSSGAGAQVIIALVELVFSLCLSYGFSRAGLFPWEYRLVAETSLATLFVPLVVIGVGLYKRQHELKKNTAAPELSSTNCSADKPQELAASDNHEQDVQTSKRPSSRISGVKFEKQEQFEPGPRALTMRDSAFDDSQSQSAKVLVDSRELALEIIKAARNRPAYLPLTGTRVRVSLKIPDREPEELMPGWQQLVQDGLTRASVGVVQQLHVRRGCTHIIAEVADMHPLALQQQQQQHEQQQLRALALTLGRDVLPAMFAAASAPPSPQQPSSPAEEHKTRPIALQLRRDACEVHRAGSRSSSNATVTEGLLGAMAALPDVIAVEPVAVYAPTPPLALAGVPTRMNVRLHLAGPLPEGCVGLARHGQGFLAVCSSWSSVPHPSAAGAFVVEVSVDLPQFPGLVHFEIMDDSRGMLGAAAPLVMVPNAAAARELRQVQGEQRACHSFLLDFGRWIGVAFTCSSCPDRRGSRPSSSTSVNQHQHHHYHGISPADAAQLRDALWVADGLLQFCLMAALPACWEMVADLLVKAYGVSPAALLHSTSPLEWFPQLDAGGDGGGAEQHIRSELAQLHHAVANGHVSMVRTLVAWAGRHDVAINWGVGGVEGLTPLHLAMLLPESGEMVKVMLSCSRDPLDITAWMSTRAADGCSPADYGRKLGRTSFDDTPRHWEGHSGDLLVQGDSFSSPASEGQQQDGSSSSSRQLPAALAPGGVENPHMDTSAAVALVPAAAGMSNDLPGDAADAAAMSALHGRLHASDLAAPGGAAHAHVGDAAPLPVLWCCIVVAKCLAGSVKCIQHGQGLPELFTLALWGTPYVACLLIAAWQAHSRAAATRRDGGVARASTPSAVAGRSLSPGCNRLGMYLHLYRSLVVLLMGLRVLEVPFVFTITSGFLLDLPAKALYTVMEAYDLRTAVVVMAVADIPAWHALYSRLGTPNAWAHVIGLGVWAAALQGVVAYRRARTAATRAAGGKGAAGSAKGQQTSGMGISTGKAKVA